jgi:dUTP pyrophosphatase
MLTANAMTGLLILVSIPAAFLIFLFMLVEAARSSKKPVETSENLPSENLPSEYIQRRLGTQDHFIEILLRRTSNLPPKLVFEKISDTATIPDYKSLGAAGMDVSSDEVTTLPAGSTVMVKTGLKVDVPHGYELQVRPRSGLSAKTKVRVANSPGTIDSDYTGEIMIILDNTDGEDNYVIKAGDRIAQLVLSEVHQAFVVEGKVNKQTERGQNGFGSTGV